MYIYIMFVNFQSITALENIEDKLDVCVKMKHTYTHGISLTSMHSTQPRHVHVLK
jgi:hypothetical protein